MGEVEVAALGQVDDAAGGADHDVDALLQGLDLRLVGAASVDSENTHALDAAGALDVGGHLQAELTGGAHDEGLRLALSGLGEVGVLGVGRRDHALEQRDAEAEGLAGAGLGLADEVTALDRRREALLLDGEGVGNAVR